MSEPAPQNKGQVMIGIGEYLHRNFTNDDDRLGILYWPDNL